MAEVVATYRDPQSARKAITMLERHGVDASCIHLLGAPDAHMAKTDEAQNAPDMSLTREVGRRGFSMALVAGIVLGAIGAGVGYAAGGMTGALLGGVGFLMVGGTLGFFYGGASGIAVSEEWSDTFETSGPTTLAVTVDDADVIDIRDRIESTRPDRIMIS